MRNRDSGISIRYISSSYYYVVCFEIHSHATIGTT
mgnify:CR=1 FL=1